MSLFLSFDHSLLLRLCVLYSFVLPSCLSFIMSLFRCSRRSRSSLFIWYVMSAFFLSLSVLSCRSSFPSLCRPARYFFLRVAFISFVHPSCRSLFLLPAFLPVCMSPFVIHISLPSFLLYFCLSFLFPFCTDFLYFLTSFLLYSAPSVLPFPLCVVPFFVAPCLPSFLSSCCSVCIPYVLPFVVISVARPLSRSFLRYVVFTCVRYFVMSVFCRVVFRSSLLLRFRLRLFRSACLPLFVFVFPFCLSFVSHFLLVVIDLFRYFFMYALSCFLPLCCVVRVVCIPCSLSSFFLS